jgi:hypothetical protein
LTYTDDIISTAIGDAIGGLPEEQYRTVMTACEEHRARVGVIEDGDSVILTIQDIPIVRVARLAFLQGREQAWNN